MGEERKEHKVLVGNPEGMRSQGRPKRIWEDGIRMDAMKTDSGVWNGFNWLRIGDCGGLL
jgi:hypothetical protein